MYPLVQQTLATFRVNDTEPRRKTVLEFAKTPDEAVPLLLSSKNDVVQRYLELSSRVLDAISSLPGEEADRAALTRVLELNAEVVTRYLDGHRDELPLLLHALPAALVDAQLPIPALAAPTHDDDTRAVTAVIPEVSSEGTPSDSLDTPDGWFVRELASVTGFSPDTFHGDLELSELGIDSLAQASLLERLAHHLPQASARAFELVHAQTLGELARLFGVELSGSATKPDHDPPGADRACARVEPCSMHAAAKEVRS